MPSTDLEALAEFLGFAPQNLYRLAYLGPNAYKKIDVPKKNSDEKRTLTVPNLELKGVQKQINFYILKRVEVHHCAYAYVPGRSVYKAAKKISNNSVVLHLDIKEFFDNISANRVYGVYKSIGYSDKASWILTKLTTYDNYICQGSPTSPFLSNIVCINLDKNLTTLARKWGLSYIRYSDDLYFCGSKDFKHHMFKGVVANVLRDNGFRLNNKKTRYFRANQPRKTLGLMTHGRSPDLPRRVRRNYRAAFFRASTDLDWARDNFEKLTGMAEWYKEVYGKDDTFLEYRRILSNVKKLRLHSQYSV